MQRSLFIILVLSHWLREASSFAPCKFSRSYSCHNTRSPCRSVSSKKLPISPPQAQCLLKAAGEDFELKDSQSLAALFNVAVACQRAGDHAAAIQHYETILDGAAQVEAPPASLAEVYVNLGQAKARLGDRPAARKHFEAAVAARDDCGTAHVNLALMSLADAQAKSSSGDGASSSSGLGAATTDLEAAADHCRRALTAEAQKTSQERDEQAMATAEKLLGDLTRALSGKAPPN